MTKWACYCRVSLDRQSQAIDNQKMVLVEYCGRLGIEYDLFEEIESTKKTRYQKYLLLQKLRKGEYCGVIVTKLDRWGRTLTELVMELNEFATKGIGFISVGDGLDLTTSNGRMMAGLLAVLANWERDLCSSRTKAGLARVRLTKSIGRRKGQKDRNPRKKSGYFLREARKRKLLDEGRGVNKPLEEYLG